MISPKVQPPGTEAKTQRDALIVHLVKACLCCFLFVVMLGGHASAESVHTKSASPSEPAQVSDKGIAQDARSARILRNAGVASLFSVIGLWIFISTRQLVRRSRLHGTPITFRHALGKLGARPLAILNRVNQAPQNSIGALLSALSCVAASTILATLSWSKAAGVAPGLLEIPWRYAMVSVGLSVSAVMLVICAVYARTGTTVPLMPAPGKKNVYEMLAPWVLAVTCALMVLCFRWLDLWNSRFNEHSWHYTLYGIARLLFMPFLAAALLGTGCVILNQLERRFGNLHCTPTERTLTAFLSGTAAWYVILLPGNLAGLLHYYLIAPAFISAVWFSAAPLIECGRIARRWLFDRLNNSTLVHLLLVSMPIAVMLICWTHLLVDRGLAITGLEYDSYGHYVPFYQAVVEHGSTDINELWYHFWISKGAALHLVATLLTDIHGPQLVSFTLLTATVFIAVLLIYSASGSATLGLCTGAMFLAPFTHGFPYYQKHHIVTVALIGGLLWLIVAAGCAAKRKMMPFTPSQSV